MQHIDEGTVHAYLDGAIDALAGAAALPAGVTRATVEAHVAACSDCRALLDAERAVRAGADSVLRDAGLATIDVPPFDFVARGRVPAAVRRRRTLPMAWAASVVLALGAGWWGSDAWRTERAATTAPDTAPDSHPTQAAQAAQASTRPTGPGGVAGPARGAAAPARGAAAPARAEAESTAPATASAEAPAGFAAASPASPPAPQRVTAGAPDGISAFAPGDAAGPPARPVAGAAAGAMAESRSQRPPARVAAGLALPEPASIGEPVQRSGFALSASLDEVVVTRVARTQAAPAAYAAKEPTPSVLPTVRTSARTDGVQHLAPSPEADRMTGSLSSERARRDVSDGLHRPLPVEVFRDAALAARSGALRWTPLRRADAHAAGLPLIMLAAAADPVFSEARLDDGDRLIRAVQMLPDGVAVELLVWRHADAAVGAITAEEKVAASGAVSTLIVSSGELPGGGRELLLRVPSLDAFVMVSGVLPPRRLLDLADALVITR